MPEIPSSSSSNLVSAATSPAARIILTILGTLLVASMTWTVGITGFYFFDSSISLSSGWYLLNGWVPFRDYRTPLMPMNAVLVSWSYKLFGVNYLSTVIVACLLAAATFIAALRPATRLVSFPLAFMATLAATLVTLPSFGTIFYNQLLSAILLLYATLTLLLMNQPAEAPATRLRLAIGMLLGAATFTKLHFAAFVALQCAVEFALWRLRRQSPARLLTVFGFAILPSLVAFGIVCLWTDVDVGLVLQSAAAPQPGALNDTIGRNVAAALGFPGGIADPPVFGRLFFILLLTCAGVAWRRSGAEWFGLLPIAFAGALIVGEQLLSMASAEPQVTHAFVYCIAVIALIQAAPTDWKKPVSLFAFPILACLLLYAVQYDNRILRKGWSDVHFTFSRLRPPTARTQVPFFNGVKLRSEHVEVIDGISLIKSSQPSLRVMFGPGLEALFPAFHTLPPRGWPNWFHPNLSYASSDVPFIHASLLNGQYDLVLLADGRDPVLIPALKAGNFHPCAKMGGWTTLYCAPGVTLPALPNAASKVAN